MFDLFHEIAFAQTTPASPAQPGFLELFGMPLAFLVIMYLLVLRPQQKKAKDHQELLKNLKVGDEVVTSGGIIARVRSVSDGFVTVDAGGNTQLKIQKSHISGLTTKVKPNGAAQKA